MKRALHQNFEDVAMSISGTIEVEDSDCSRNLVERNLAEDEAGS